MSLGEFVSILKNSNKVEFIKLKPSIFIKLLIVKKLVLIKNKKGKKVYTRVL